mmetsp:Transcript_49867/g.117303  ORF Transcript_49867/g.117303 Transcript_49867/m.117303 type:complete len:353 (-) Transcript_49867:459-1517(-)
MACLYSWFSFWRCFLDSSTCWSNSCIFFVIAIISSSTCTLSVFTSSTILDKSSASCLRLLRLSSELRLSALHQSSFLSSSRCSFLRMLTISDTFACTVLKSILPDRKASASSATRKSGEPCKLSKAFPVPSLPEAEETWRSARPGFVGITFSKMPWASSFPRSSCVSAMACSSSWRVVVRLCQSCSCWAQLSFVSARNCESSLTFLLLSSIDDCVLTMSTLIWPILVVLASISVSKVAISAVFARAMPRKDCWASVSRASAAVWSSFMESLIDCSVPTTRLVLGLVAESSPAAKMLASASRSETLRFAEETIWRSTSASFVCRKLPASPFSSAAMAFSTAAMLFSASAFKAT